MERLSDSHLMFLKENVRKLDHHCNLDLYKPAQHQCLTSIIVTVSRNSRNMKCILGMLDKGMQIARINMGHHSHDYHSTTINMLRKAALLYDQSKNFKKGLAIALELRGPQIHTGFLACGEDLELEAGGRFQLSTNKDHFFKGSKERIFVGYAQLTSFVSVGHRVNIDDGQVALIVRDMDEETLYCDISKGGTLKANKVIKFPDSQLDLPSITEKDIFDLQFAMDKNVDMLIMPQIRNASSVFDIKNILGRKGSHILLISKIEKKESLSCIDEIIEASDAILFARADLYLEVPISKVFVAQKAVMAKCQKVGKPFIVANCVLSSLIKSLDPICSEVTELAGIISDGVDCIVMTTATGIGEHPVESVEMAAKICKEAELATWHSGFHDAMLGCDKSVLDASYGTAMTTITMAKNALATAIIVMTTTGRTAYMLSKYKPRCPIFAVTRCLLTFRKLKLFRGVIPILYRTKSTSTMEPHWYDRFDARLEYALWVGKRTGFIKTSDAVIVMGPWQVPVGYVHKVRLLYAFFEEDFKIKKKAVKKEVAMQKAPNYCCRRCRI